MCSLTILSATTTSLVICSSVAVLVEILCRSPRKLFIFIIKKKITGKSIQQRNHLILKKTSLACRAAKTLLYYFQETNVNYHHWLGDYIKQHPIPRDGKWDDVSGETFLRTLLTGGLTEAKAQVTEDMFSCVRGLGIDPRVIAQRVMEIRKALAAEFIQVSTSVAVLAEILHRSP